ncbi:hydroxymethylglutaryl-CoA lyase [Cupriavidus necator]|uniref:Hydroxymethylglutaryl-CoA lyase n=1 Tax=Cupriavidus necator TaxID=106590 RepID=A0A1U9UYH9_CUPNE|nr:hypothetical protein [Cupriavidus necator]AQV97457.1 hydroxymethylglutaryl-CoA lyase [Cupriavidus necator]
MAAIGRDDLGEDPRLAHNDGRVQPDISGQVIKAGKSTDLHPVPEWVGAR